MPLTLVLGLTTTATALHGMLSSEVTDRCMHTQHFKLVGGRFFMLPHDSVARLCRGLRTLSL